MGFGFIIANNKSMTTQIIIVLILTFLINLITTLSYSVRIVGIRTGRVAIFKCALPGRGLVSRIFVMPVNSLHMYQIHSGIKGENAEYD